MLSPNLPQSNGQHSTIVKAPHKFIKVYIWLVLTVLIVTLGCANITYTVQFYPEGQGDGKVFLEVSVPEKINDQISITQKQIQENLEKQGWLNIKTERHKNGLLIVTAEYPFGPGENDPQLAAVLKNTEYKIEASENDYMYYTLTTDPDLTQITDIWAALEGAAQNGAEVDLGPLLGKQETITQEDAQQLINTYGKPSYTLRVCLPGNTPVDISPQWSNTDKYLNGTDPCAVYRWEPQKRKDPHLEVQRRLEPNEEIDPAEAQANLERLFEMYRQEIPEGSVGFSIYLPGMEILSPGQINNYFVANFNGDNYICSDYQEKVLRWLDTIRTHADPEVRSLLNGLDYGPIQINGGGHRSVVIYRSGGDWRTAGYVLDPWRNQTPEVYRIKDWWESVPYGLARNSQPEPDMDSGQLYPHLNGKPVSYPAAEIYQGDLSTHRDQTKPTRILLVRSPVNVMITLPGEKRVGVTADGQLVNEAPGEVFFYTMPKSDALEEIQWEFYIVPEVEYSIQVIGTNKGEYHIVAASPDGIYGYGPQPIFPGQEVHTQVGPDGVPYPYIPPGGGQPNKPFELTEDNIQSAMGFDSQDASPETNQPSTEEDDEWQAQDDAGEYSGVGADVFSVFLLCCCCMSSIGVIVAIFLLIRKRMVKNRVQPLS